MWKGKASKAALAAVAFSSLLTGAAAPSTRAPAIEAAGRVVDVTPPGSVQIVGQNKPPQVAAHGVLLHPGDWLDFRREGELVANVYGRRVTYTATSPDRQIPKRAVGRYGPQDLSFFERFVQFLSSPRAAIPVFPWVRGTPPPGITLESSQFAPTGRVLVPRGTTQLALIWRSGPAELVVQPPKGPATRLRSERNAWLLVPLPTHADGVRITAEGQSLSWTIGSADRVPAPPWLENKADLSEAERLVRASWLLSHGPSQWRAFAVTELAELSERGSFPGNQLWTGARSGELAEELWR